MVKASTDRNARILHQLLHLTCVLATAAVVRRFAGAAHVRDVRGVVAADAWQRRHVVHGRWRRSRR